MSQPKTALIVDDMPDMRALLKTTLLKLGFESVSEAENAAEALAIYREYRIDMIFMDINMPGIGGLQLLAEMTRSYPEAHIVMVSGESSINNVRAAIGFGAKGFIAKPYNQEKIEEALKRF